MSSSPLLLHDRIRPVTDPSLAEAVRALRQGALVGMPTETVYGLAADATSGTAVARIYEAKGRPSFNPLISHCPDLGSAESHGWFSPAATRLAEAFWPGPLTLVLKHRDTSTVSDLARAGLETIALRVPAHPVALALLKAFGGPLAAPSANRSGRISPTAAQDVIAELGDQIACVLDGGPCAVGLESTVVACIDGHATLLRPGGIPREDIERVLGDSLRDPAASDQHRGPGMLASHYAPLAPMRLNTTRAEAGDALLTFAAHRFVGQTPDMPVIDLSPAGNLTEAAARLFQSMRRLDSYQPRAIAVAPIPSEGLGEAINDRLTRAAVRQ